LLSLQGLQAGDEPEVLRGPYIQGLTETSVEIIWVMNRQGEGRVRCVGEDGQVIDQVGSRGDNQRVLLEGLRPATRYVYSVFSGEELLDEGEHLRFRTAPPTGEGSLRAVMVGDSGTGSKIQAGIGSVMEGLDADLFLHTGDLIYNRSLSSGIFRPYRTLLSKSCLFAARGNHDFDMERMGVEWRDLFTIPNDESLRTDVYYSFDWGPAHFLVLDYIITGAQMQEQLAFAERDLSSARSRGVPWLIIYQHLPLYTAGAYANYNHPIRVELPELCDRYEVDLVCSGHDHNYQRSYPTLGRVVRDGWQDPVFERPRGTVYIVTGGGGGHLYGELPGARDRPFIRTFQSVNHCMVFDISPGELRARALDIEGETLDDFRLRKSAPRPSLSFVRGDANLDGVLDLADVLTTLGFLFLGDELPCPAAADSTGEGSQLVITRPIYTLRFLFMGGTSPPAPFPFCGASEDADDAFCYEPGC
jgi:hypothetical protein